MTTDTPTVSTAVAHLRYGLELLEQLERQNPAEVRRVADMLVAHVRSWKPEAISPMGVV